MPLSTPKTLTPKSQFQSSILRSCMSPKMRTPALLHSTWTAPNSAYDASAAACTDAKSETSVCRASARAPRACTSDATTPAASSSMSAMTTFIPALASSSAIARPMPLPLPVTTAVRPARSSMRPRSRPREVRRALLGERAWALFGVVRLEHGAAVVPFVRQRFRLGHPVGLAQGAQHGFHGDGAVRGDGRRDLARCRQRLTVGHHVADQADPGRLVGGEVLAGQQDLGRMRVRDLAPEPYRGAAHGVERPADLAHAEARRHSRDPDVGLLEDLRATRDRDALHRGDEGLGR